MANARVIELLADLGHTDAWSHVNSGNFVFDATGSRQKLEASIERKLEKEFGFEVTTFVRTEAEVRKALDAKPFPVASGDTYFVTFLKVAPSAATSRQLEALSNKFDTLVIKGRDVHWRMRGKSTDTHLKTKDWDQLVGRHCSTSRNTTMLRALMSKIDAR